MVRRAIPRPLPESLRYHTYPVQGRQRSSSKLQRSLVLLWSFSRLLVSLAPGVRRCSTAQRYQSFRYRRFHSTLMPLCLRNLRILWECLSPSSFFPRVRPRPNHSVVFRFRLAFSLVLRGRRGRWLVRFLLSRTLHPRRDQLKMQRSLLPILLGWMLSVVVSSSFLDLL